MLTDPALEAFLSCVLPVHRIIAIAVAAAMKSKGLSLHFRLSP
jgi:hypothetical protein